MEVSVMRKLKISATIEDDNGQVIVTNISERLIPYIEEIEEKGFRIAYNDLENAFLDSRKEVCDRTVSEYLEITSKKKPKTNRILEK